MYSDGHEGRAVVTCRQNWWQIQPLTSRQAAHTCARTCAHPLELGLARQINWNPENGILGRLQDGPAEARSLAWFRSNFCASCCGWHTPPGSFSDRFPVSVPWGLNRAAMEAAGLWGNHHTTLSKKPSRGQPFLTVSGGKNTPKGEGNGLTQASCKLESFLPHATQEDDRVTSCTLHPDHTGTDIPLLTW